MQNLKPLACLYSWAGQFESYPVANFEDKFSRDKAHLIVVRSLDDLGIKQLQDLFSCDVWPIVFNIFRLMKALTMS